MSDRYIAEGKDIATVSVLGEPYDIIEATAAIDKNLTTMDGYCDPSVHICVVEAMTESELGMKKDLMQYKKSVIRHELIHAFLHESGLAECSDWAGNEEMVDWIAKQFPKMLEAFEQAGCI